MARFISLFCLVLVVINVCEAALPDGQKCPVEAYVVNETDRITATESAIVDRRKYDDPECPCVKKMCLALCCPMGSVVTERERRGCSAVENASALEFPPYDDPQAPAGPTGQLRIQDFHVFPWNPCRIGEMFELAPEDNVEYRYKLLANGSIYLPYGERSVDFTNYCFAAVENSTVYNIVLCGLDNMLDALPETSPVIIGLYHTTDVLSTVGFLATFAIYSVLPEMRNTHGATVRGYVGTMFVANFAAILIWVMPKSKQRRDFCIILANLANFFSLAGFFWLNVMCFDIWRTFGRFSVLKGNTRHREKNKLCMYKWYVWGTTVLINMISIMMECMPEMINSFVTPKFGEGICWYTTMTAHLIYYCVPIAMMGLFNLCFYLSTIQKIMLHRKDMATQLNGSDSRRHEDNKQELNIYVKLFIMMGTNWSLDILSWLCNYKPEYLWIALEVFDGLQGVIVFVIFVWKGKVRRLLLKRLGYRKRSATNAANKAPSRENSRLNSEPTKSSDEDCCTLDGEHQTGRSQLHERENAEIVPRLTQ